MKTISKPVMGITATSPKPDPRGFLIIAVALSGPVALLLFGAEFLLRWGW